MFQKIKTYTNNHEIISLLLYALILNIIIELLSRSQLLSLITHITNYPLYFIYNVFVIAFTMSIGFFFKRRSLVMFLIGAIWFFLGIANFVVLSYRITPFSAIDLFIMEWNLNFIKTYLSVPLVITIIVAIIILNMVLPRIYRHSSTTKANIKLASILLVSLFAISSGLYFTFTLSGTFGSRILDMQEYYDNYGFVVCFSRSALERGIDEPDDYSRGEVEDVIADAESQLEDLEEDALEDQTIIPDEDALEDQTEVPDEDTLEDQNCATTETPNIIVIQLESFFDPDLIVDTEYSENPIPFFTELSENYSSGVLNVPVVGAGTANTEFEVVTGMSVDFFGTGEYPYETILQESTCESNAYVLTDLGYTNFAIHNNTGTFYQRFKVYPNLGFDTFISSEFITNPTYTPEGWIKDECITSIVQECLESTTTQDFIFTISVQGHGPFPEEKDPNNLIQVTSSPFDEILESQIEYYVNQLYEMDLFVKELTEYLETLDEPTVLVLYGDHIPSLDLEKEDIEGGNNYQTEYVIWSNYELEVVDQELETYQLMAVTLDKVGIHSGIINTLHQAYLLNDPSEEETLDYVANLELLQYDLLYGNYYSLNYRLHKPTDMTMGVGDILISTYINKNTLYIESPKLTEYSYVFVNDKKTDATYTNGILEVSIDDIESGDSIVIKQISPDHTVLYESPAQIITYSLN